MADTRNLYLAFNLMGTATETLHPGMSDFVRSSFCMVKIKQSDRMKF